MLKIHTVFHSQHWMFHVKHFVLFSWTLLILTPIVRPSSDLSLITPAQHLHLIRVYLDSNNTLILKNNTACITLVLEVHNSLQAQHWMFHVKHFVSFSWTSLILTPIVRPSPDLSLKSHAQRLHLIRVYLDSKRASFLKIAPRRTYWCLKSTLPLTYIIDCFTWNVQRLSNSLLT
jgi:hypothetical protein